ncbi:araC family transcriptional regulator [Streptomyces laurentii]|uniref:AraC family transcriptional regulator n=1 Tax=Streptomyces laurentii TaxID=39478 RepID=A0A160NUT0_STRLU|nr:araC family transcriptional regulator [Streptomyces laurentii]
MRSTEHAATVDFVERSPHADLRLEHVAAHVGYSPYHLHRSFRRAFGLALHTYVRRRRLTEAARALVDTSDPVLGIALRHGFRGQQSFTSAFSAGYGVPPATWRRTRPFFPLLPYRSPRFTVVWPKACWSARVSPVTFEASGEDGYGGLGMLVTEFRTDVVAGPERFALWREATGQSHMPNRLRSNAHNDFQARMRGLNLSEVQVAGLAYPHLEIARTTKLIRQSDPEVYQFNYFLGGHGTLTVDRRDVALGAGDLVVMDSSRPYQGEVYADPGRWSHVTVQCPRGLLPLPEKAVQRLLAVPISGRHGMGGVLARWLTDLNTRAGEFTRADIPTLASVTLDLLASVIAGCSDAEKALDPEARRSTLRVQINAFVEQHLADPAMTPQTIADAHHISLRHLQQLLAENELRGAVFDLATFNGTWPALAEAVSDE